MDQGSLAHFVLGAVFVSSSQSGVDHRRLKNLDIGRFRLWCRPASRT
jgi:hypothetical protein